MTGEVTIKVEGLGKAYRLGTADDRPTSFLSAVARTATAPLRNFRRLRGLSNITADARSDDVIWALDDVSFDIRGGEVVGFIGANGAGKSTLLKILSRITKPTTGTVKLRGRVSSLLEVGTGFHPELSGRENILMNGTILGMSRAEIDRKFDEIVAFSGIERFLDTPIKRYSSGMKVRLGFAVAAHLEPDIMIVDEVLAVGDAEFQRRCLGTMESVARTGRTVLFVSHNMGAIQNLCSRAILLREGRIVEDGEPGDVVKRYLSAFSGSYETGFGPDNRLRETTGPVRFKWGRMLDGRGQVTIAPVSGEALGFELALENQGPAVPIRLRLIFKDEEGANLFALHSGIAGEDLRVEKEATFRITIPRLPLPAGRYRVAAAVMSASDGLSDRIPNAFLFEIDTSVFHPGGLTPSRRVAMFLVDHEWEQLDVPAQALLSPASDHR